MPRRRAPSPDPVLRASRLALLTTSAVHLGFQSVVTALVYPQLFEGSTHALAERQLDHTRRIAPLAVSVYAGTVGSAGWAAVSSLRARGEKGLAATAVACAAAVMAPAITGAVAVPLLAGVATEKATARRLWSILASDRVRTAIAAVGVAAAAQSLSE